MTERSRGALLLGGLAFAELSALAARIAIGGHSVFGLVSIHAVALVGAGSLVYLARRAGRDTTYPLIALISGVPLGPLGIFGAALLMLASRSSPRPSPIIAEWYERIALSTTVPPEVRLCDDVEVGRTIALESPAPLSFPDAMMTGSLTERQAILGHIARHFHPSYLATLKIALASEEALIRVQAAAVAAHIAPNVRTRLKHCIREADATSGDPLAALSLLGDIEALIGSGLLDESDRLEAQHLACTLGDRLLADVVRAPLELPFATDPARAAELETHLEQLLISRRRFGELRSQRNARHLHTRHPRARLKRLNRAPRLREAAR